jgi:hypothetical protein
MRWYPSYPMASGRSCNLGASRYLAGEAAALSRLLPVRSQCPQTRKGFTWLLDRGAGGLSPLPITPEPDKSLFLNEARKCPKRYRIIDAELTEIHKIILQAVLERLPKPNPNITLPDRSRHRSGILLPTHPSHPPKRIYLVPIRKQAPTPAFRGKKFRGQNSAWNTPWPEPKEGRQCPRLPFSPDDASRQAAKIPALTRLKTDACRMFL